MQTGCDIADSLNNLPQKASAIFKASPVLSFSCVRPKKFVTQVAMAVLDVNKVETQLASHARCDVEPFDDCVYFCVSKHSSIGHLKPAIQNRVVIGDTWFRAVVLVWTAVTSRVGQLQPNQQTLAGTSRVPMFVYKCRP